MANNIQTFEQGFKEYFQSDDAFAFWKARVALYAYLKAAGVREGDEVILPGYTCVMDVNPIKYVGATPVYVDIDPQTYNMNVDLLEDKITERTKVIIAQHTYGYVCEIDRMLEIAQKYGISVIEDCCLSFGSTYKGKPAGTFSQAAYFSFQWNKPFTTGVGGMLVSHDPELSENVRDLQKNEMVKPGAKEKALLAAQLMVYHAFIYPRTTAMAQNLFRWMTKKGLVVGSSSTEEFDPEMPEDFFKGMSGLQAGVGIKKMNRIQKNISHRIATANLYDALLEAKGLPSRIYDSDIQQPVMVRYPIRVQDKNKALEDASAKGIELGSWFECPLHPIETPLEKYNYQPGFCPHAEKASEEVVNLPVHPRVSEKTVKRTVEFISKYAVER